MIPYGTVYHIWHTIYHKLCVTRPLRTNFRPSVHPSTSVHILIFLMVRRLNTSMRWTVSLLPPPSIYEKTIACRPWGGRSAPKFWSVLHMDGWTVRRRLSSSVEACMSQQFYFLPDKMIKFVKCQSSFSHNQSRRSFLFNREGNRYWYWKSHSNIFVFRFSYLLNMYTSKALVFKIDLIECLNFFLLFSFAAYMFIYLVFYAIK